MSEKGISSLAEIARVLETTPQAVSNWKSRDQIPNHIVIKVNALFLSDINNGNQNLLAHAYNSSQRFYSNFNPFDFKTTSLSDILVVLAQQIKVIVFTIFLFTFISFTYLRFLKPPIYTSWATVVLPESKTSSSLGNLAGLASQFGVNVPMDNSADLSSPSLYPEIIKSRTFAEKILNKEFYTDKYKKKLPLINILTFGDEAPNKGIDTLITEALNILNEDYISYYQEPKSSFSKITISAPEPSLAKNLADEVLYELEKLNRYFKNKNVTEKIEFITNRILSVEIDLRNSEKELRDFRQKNMQISSPSLLLQEDRLQSEVEIQKGIYLTLKQQLELSKIEEIQEKSIVQILDKPVMPIRPSNKNLVFGVALSIFVGTGMGVILGFIRSFLANDNSPESRKIAQFKNFLNMKTKDIFLDKRMSGSIFLIMLFTLPIYLGYESENPVFFNRYSYSNFIIIIIYIIIMVLALINLIKLKKNKSNF